MDSHPCEKPETETAPKDCIDFEWLSRFDGEAFDASMTLKAFAILGFE